MKMNNFNNGTYNLFVRNEYYVVCVDVCARVWACVGVFV